MVSPRAHAHNLGCYPLQLFVGGDPSLVLEFGLGGDGPLLLNPP